MLIRGLTYESERWRLATVGEWLPSGSHLPHSDVADKLRRVCRELFDLFEHRNRRPPGAGERGASDEAA